MKKIVLALPTQKDVALDLDALKEHFQRKFFDSGIVVEGESSICIKNTSNNEEPWNLEVFFLPVGAGVHISRALVYARENSRELDFARLYCLVQRIYGEKIFKFITTPTNNGVVVTVLVEQSHGSETVAIFSGKRTIL